MSHIEKTFLGYVHKKGDDVSITMSSGFIYKGTIHAMDEKVIEIEERVSTVDRRAVLIYRKYIAMVARDETFSHDRRENVNDE